MMKANTSQKQRCLDIIEQFPEEQLPMLADSLETMYKMLDDAIDMAFCIGLSEHHKKSNPVFIEEDFSPIEDVAKRNAIHVLEIGNRGDVYK